MAAPIRKKNIILVCLLLILISGGVFVNSLNNRFTFDDIHIVEQNPIIRSTASIPRLFKSEYWASTQYENKDSKLYRPLTMMSYALMYAAFGSDPLPFHFGNVIIHTVNVLLCFFLFFYLSKSMPVSFLGALLFAVHPVHVEAVSGIVGRAELLTAMFCLFSFWSFAAWRDTSRGNILYMVSVLCFALGLLAKETAIVLPVLLLVYDTVIKKKIETKAYSGYLTALAGYILLKYLALGGLASTGTEVFFKNETLFTRLLTMSTVLAQYLKLLFIPYPLNPDWGLSGLIPVSHSPADPAVLGSLLVLAAAGYLFYRASTTAPLIAFSLLWFLAALIPVSNIIPFGDLMAERFLYLPSVGFCFAFALFFVRNRLSRLRIAVLLFFILVCSVLTLWQNPIWENNTSLWSYVTRTFPRNWRAFWELGKVYRDNGDQDRAITLFSKSIELRENDLVLYDMALLLKDRDLKQAFTVLDRLIVINPRLPGGYLLRAICREKAGDYPGAETDYANAVLVDTSNDIAWYSAGTFYLKKNDYAKARQCFEESLKLQPDRIAALTGLGNCYFAARDYANSEQCYQKALVLDSSHYESMYNLIVVYCESGKRSDAQALLAKLQEQYSDNENVRRLEAYIQKKK